MDDVRVEVVEARTHGRALVRVPVASPPPWPLLVGFHGYAETARVHMDALQRIPGTAEWLLVAVQALHRFYARADRVVASWMTREDRELAIADNVEYVGRVLTHVKATYEVKDPLVFAGFSQGAAMAYRAAAHYPSHALIVLAGDVPPDVVEPGHLSLPPVLLGRGTRDEWYTEAKEAADRALLAKIGAHVDVCVFEGGHEWTDPFHAAVASVLRAVRGGDATEQ
jgi:predicted esterase